MKKVTTFSLLLLIGLFFSQSSLLVSAKEFVPWLGATIQFFTLACLAYIMIEVGREFDIDKKNLRGYAVDYGVAATAAAFPWIFCTLYFLWIMMPAGSFFSFEAWKESLLAARFSAPTSAGVLFSMLAAAGLTGTWMFKKARILAIFDDLDTVLLMIPLKILIVGFAWQLGVSVFVMGVFLILAWKYLHALRVPSRWNWVLLYSAGVAGVCEIIYQFSKSFNAEVPIHIEVLLPAFALGCMLPRHNESPSPQEKALEQKVNTTISAIFMVLVGLSMPSVMEHIGSTISVSTLFWHVLAITVLSNLGKMFALFCYRKEATFKERLAVAVAMFPRGEVGAGVLILSLSYGIGGPIVTVAMLSLALNLVMTGVFILIVKKLLQVQPKELNTRFFQKPITLNSKGGNLDGYARQKTIPSPLSST